MENRQSLLKVDHIEIASTIDNTSNLTIKIPTVGEILDNEQKYYRIISSLTASPFQYMVQLYDMGIDYSKIDDYDLFKILFPILVKDDLSIIFGNTNVSDFSVYQHKNEELVLYSPQNNIVIDKLMYEKLVDILRKINLIEKKMYKHGNEHAREYLIKKERKKLERYSPKKYEPYLEKNVIVLVNMSEFPYNYDSCMGLSIYRFNQSIKQILHKVDFDNTMMGVYSGTVDVSKITDKNCLSLIPISN